MRGIGLLRRIRKDLKDWIDPVQRREEAHSRYLGYSEADLSVFQAFPPVRVQPQQGHFVDFLGVLTRSNYASGFGVADGKILGLPVPYSDTLHAETVEWIGLLKAVLDARGRFAAMELGAGWGPWLVAGAVAAGRRGIEDIRLCGVEGDSAHFGFLLQHFRDNGLDPDAHCLIRAAVGVEVGTARWPVIDDPAADYGSRPIDATGHDGNDVSSYTEVEQVAFSDLLKREEVWDFIHIDVQGGEFTLVVSEADLLDHHARRMVIGTHSRKIEGDLIDLLFRRGWLLENEKPAKFTYSPAATSPERMTTLDGTQVWKNPRL